MRGVGIEAPALRSIDLVRALELHIPALATQRSHCLHGHQPAVGEGDLRLCRVGGELDGDDDRVPSLRPGDSYARRDAAALRGDDSAGAGRRAHRACSLPPNCGPCDGGAVSGGRFLQRTEGSKMFFLNTEAIINRGISLLQTLHQRRYWEQFTWHPRSVDDQFAV